MRKKFNVTGLCLPDIHYMADISDRLEEIRVYIEEGNYFTINRARQYGKTTTLNALKRRFENEYMIFLISFEGIEEEVFADVGSFCVRLFGLLYDTIDFGEVEGGSGRNSGRTASTQHGRSKGCEFPHADKPADQIMQRSRQAGCTYDR